MTTSTETIAPGVVIQIAPPHRWAGTFWIVDELRKWGVIAYCTLPGQPGAAYIRLEWEQFAVVGPAPFRRGPMTVADQKEAQ